MIDISTYRLATSHWQKNKVKTILHLWIDRRVSRHCHPSPRWSGDDFGGRRKASWGQLLHITRPAQSIQHTHTKTQWNRSSSKSSTDNVHYKEIHIKVQFCESDHIVFDP